MSKIVPILKNSVGPIESGVPFPTAKIGNAKQYYFDKMKVGDSFTVPIEQRNSVMASSWAFKHRNNKMNWKFITRIEGDRARIWRIK